MTQKLIPLLMLLVGIGVLIVVLAHGRLDQQETQIQSCRGEGQLAFMVSGQKWDEDGVLKNGNRYILLCMNKNGYNFDFLGKNCQPLFNGGEMSMSVSN